jgi:collagenase-like PrtC family protease
MKSSYYVATIVKAYRDAIDAYYEDPENYSFDPKWMEELSKATIGNIRQVFISASLREGTDIPY